ncbi:hypothetical protein [Paracoccus thiocyanatus]|uniref:hypothetical protein n=1 Tax=Paracoccus thiocyanatus TaxID=34006 RepID=UPI0021635B41|nr:hypothetical protein [Paracoccus thiocyanatus]
MVIRDGDRGTVSLRRVQTAGPAPGGRLTIASGLAEGEEVVIRGIHSLTEGQTVGPSVTP